MSSKLRTLVGRLRELRETFLPPQNATGNYTVLEYDGTSAFLLLAHAEIEAFIEQQCLEIAHKCVESWKSDGKPRTVVLALAAFADSQGQNAIPDTASGPPSIMKVIDEAKKHYSKRVADNHGIKTKNLLALYLPVGLREAEFPSGFLQEADSFGRERGQHAHQSYGAKTPPDPADSLQSVTTMVKGLWHLQSHIHRLLSESSDQRSEVDS